MQVPKLLDVEVHLETLEARKAEGRFRYIGITNTSAQRYPRVEALLDDGDNMGACRGRLPDEPTRRRMEQEIDAL